MEISSIKEFEVSCFDHDTKLFKVETFRPTGERGEGQELPSSLKTITPAKFVSKGAPPGIVLTVLHEPMYVPYTFLPMRDGNETLGIMSAVFEEEERAPGLLVLSKTSPNLFSAP